MNEHQDQKFYWKNIEDLKRDPNRPSEPEGEFRTTPAKEDEQGDGMTDENRRTFLKLMGASLALMGTSACTRRPIEKIVAYVNKPEDVTPGVANWYASTSTECPCGCGILVKTREGRPIKFEGNPKHPVNKGGLCARAQASVLNLYDPDRLQGPLAPARKGVGTGISWDELDTAVAAKIRAGRGGVRVLTGELYSPTTEKLIREFVNGVGGKHVRYEAIGTEEVQIANELSYGTRVVPRYRIEEAEMLVSFGADFLGTWLSPSEFNRAFAKNRKVGKNAPRGEAKSMSRYVAFEPIMTLSGTNADERYRVKSGDEYKAALALAHELIVRQGRTRYAGNGDVASVLAPYAAANVANHLGIPAKVFTDVARDLWEKRGRSLILGGGHTAKGETGVALEVAVNLLNSALENEGATVDGVVSPRTEQTSYKALLELIQEMKAGRVSVLVMHKINPLYAFPKGLGFEDALKNVPTVVTFADHFDETARVSDYVGALSHHTEKWGDASMYVGVFSIVQPTIRPLYNTRGVEEALMAWAKKLGLGGAMGSSPSWHDYLQASWRESVYSRYGVNGPFPLFWEEVLREGAFNGLSKGYSPRARQFSTSSLRSIPKLSWDKELALVLYPKIGQFDGRNSNNGWLLELPDPVTKITWDNYASVSATLAKKMGLKEGDVVKLESEGTSLEAPVHVQPGMHDTTIAIAVGYGRSNAGRVGDKVGVNVYPLALPTKSILKMSALPVNITKTGKVHRLASTQKHHQAEGRPIVKEAPLKAYRGNPRAGNEKHAHNITLWPEYKYASYRWGMAIDLNSCTGCGSCVIGCQSENNVPVVGKQFVLDSKEMHWLRIDRYYSGSVEDPQVVHQPMLCQHCENAPCETVCPVLATLHDHEGINQQVYNRCVGTRYCANNCPYKVRRFNWFTFTEYAKPLNLQYNPDVTVRTRGVMEKCTFCIQRIRGAKDTAKDLARKVLDGEVKTACQQSCPTDAIVFGDINDKNTEVSKIAADPRGYHVLEELNVRPSVTYLTKIRNTDVDQPATNSHGQTEGH